MAKEVLTAVRKNSPFRIDVSELLRRPGSSRRVEFRAPLDAVELPLTRVTRGSEVEFDLALESLVDGIHVRGTATAKLDLGCRRCLRATTGSLTTEVDELFVARPVDGEDCFPIVDDAVDLEPAVRDAVVLALPSNPLCREDCKGLCPSCGADRNENDCGHTEEHIDIRWEALARLRERMEE
ncbi:MAG: DUF177 domain-containing protein [Actinomycetota bacterium]